MVNAVGTSAPLGWHWGQALKYIAGPSLPLSFSAPPQHEHCHRSRSRLAAQPRAIASKSENKTATTAFCHRGHEERRKNCNTHDNGKNQKALIKNTKNGAGDGSTSSSQQETPNFQVTATAKNIAVAVVVHLIIGDSLLAAGC